MGNITVIGAGLYENQLTIEAAALLTSKVRVILHTIRCGAASYLDKKSIKYEALDYLYDECDDFDEHARAAADAVVQAACEADVAYCVFDIRDESAHILIKSGAKVIPGPCSEGALMAMCGGDLLLTSASDWEKCRFVASRGSLVREIDSRELACEVKLKLMETYPDDANVYMLFEHGNIKSVKLYEMDRQMGYDHTVSALVMPENDVSRRNSCELYDVANAARSSAYYVAKGFDDLCEHAKVLAGGAAYAEDRGEFSMSEIIMTAYSHLCNVHQN